MADDIANNKRGFSLFAPNSSSTSQSIQAKSDDKPHNASLFSRYTPTDSQDENQDKPKKVTKSGFGHISSLGDLSQYGFVIEVDEGEDGNVLIEMLNAILPFLTVDMLGLISQSHLNIVELLDRIMELLSQQKEAKTEHELELILDELDELKRKEKANPRKLRFKIFGNQRQVGLSFENDLDDENARHAAEQLAREIQKLFDKQKAQKRTGSPSSLLGLDQSNPAAGTSTERLNFQLRSGNGAMMTVLLSYLIQFAAGSIVNTIAKGNPNLTGLLTKFDPAQMNRTVNLAGKNGHPGMTANIQGSGNQVSITLSGSADAVKKLGAGLKGMMPSAQSANLWSNAGKPSSSDSGPSGPSSR